MRLQFHREMWAAYAVLAASSVAFYAGCVVWHFVFHDDHPGAGLFALIAVAFSAAVFIVWRRRNDLAGWIGIIWWGGGALLSVYAAISS